MKSTVTTLGVCLFAVASAVAAQNVAPGPTFEVASIRPSASESLSGGGGPSPGGQYSMRNVPVRTLISIAYDIPANRVLDGPGWMATDRYDIIARTKENPTRAETSQMMQALLRERFRLEARVDKRELPIYSLVMARQDRQLGPGMRRSTVDCLNPAAAKAAAAAAPPGRMACGFTTAQGAFTGGSIAMSTMETILTSAAGRPVLDRTGLTGRYDIDLKWAATPQADGDAVAIFTAVQEQLGLKLESGTAPLDVVLVDRVERPSEN